jgi:hypothetical protein
MLTVAHLIAGLETCGAERMLARSVTTTDPVRFRGDAGLIVGDPDRIVPPREPDALAAAWDRVIALGAEGRRALGAAAAPASPPSTISARSWAVTRRSTRELQ